MTNLVLDQELDTLDGGSSGLRDSGGNTTHCSSVSIYSRDDDVVVDSSQRLDAEGAARTQEVNNESL